MGGLRRQQRQPLGGSFLSSHKSEQSNPTANPTIFTPTHSSEMIHGFCAAFPRCCWLPLLMMVLLGTDKFARATEEADPNMSSNNNNIDFCNEFAHLSLCQLRQQLTQFGQLLDLAIGEIDFLAGGGPSFSGAAGDDSETQPLTAAKRAGVSRSLAGAPLLVRLASRGVHSSSGNGGGAKVRATGTLLGGPMRQTPPGQTRAATYRLIRLPALGDSRGRQAMAGSSSTSSSGAAGQSQAGQLLRQLWA